MDYEELYEVIEPILGHELNNRQEEVVTHADGPLWVVAGPGSGKTEVLVIKTLKLLFVDRVPPSSIFVTTFTEKAAKNLFDRILNYAVTLFSRYPELESEIDIYQLRIGTLHSLCIDVMQEYRYPGYENVRLMDDMEQFLFLYEHASLARAHAEQYNPVWLEYPYLVDQYQSRWSRTNAAVSLFNRLVEDRIDLQQLRASSDGNRLLVEAYEDYQRCMENHRKCDFAHVQQKFLNFLHSDLGSLFVHGDSDDLHPGIHHVLVDEYQDTNPIQEEIYFALASKTHNITIVGDDDQALYRFRGGTVDCMITFGQTCERFWGYPSDNVRRIFLHYNYRSHPDIVAYFDRYIRSFPSMQIEGARVEDKPPLTPEREITEQYPRLGYMTGRTIEQTAQNFGRFVRGLLDNGVIQDPSQCVLLMRSTREGPRNALHFVNALNANGIQTYNPRSRGFLEQDEICLALGALIRILDPELEALESIRGERIHRAVERWVGYYDNYVRANRVVQRRDPSGLAHYVRTSVREIRNQTQTMIRRDSARRWLDVTLLEVFYRLLSLTPFNEWEEDPERTYRLGRLTNLLESYSSIPYPNAPGSGRGTLKGSSTDTPGISFRWRQKFYYGFVGYLANRGMNDPEDKDVITPRGRLSVMTVHQAKGLEFPLVFVYPLSQGPDENDSSIRLEEALIPYRYNQPFVAFTRLQKAEHDLIRFYYVAYSRPIYALIHLIPSAHFRDGKIGFPSMSARALRDQCEDVTPE